MKWSKKTCMNCGTSGCDHKDARRCSNGHYLWTPKLSEIEQLRQRVQELEFALAETEALEMSHGERIKKLTAERDELTQQIDRLVEAATMAVEMIEYNKHERRHVRWKLNDAIASVKEKQNAAN